MRLRSIAGSRGLSRTLGIFLLGLSSAGAEPAPAEADSAKGPPLETSEAPRSEAPRLEAAREEELVQVEVLESSIEGASRPSEIHSSRPLCPVVCEQDEACINGRCVVACSPACKGGTFCSPEGRCLPLKTPKKPRTEEEVQRELGGTSAHANEAFVVDLGGILSQGIRLGYERGRAHAWLFRLQLMNTGVLSYTVEPQNEFQRFEYGLGGGLGYRRYEGLWGNLRGFYWGGGGQYQVVRVIDDSRDWVARFTHWVNPYAEMGYRWAFGKYLFGFGPLLTVRMPIAHGLFEYGSGKSCVSQKSCETPGSARFEGTLVLEVGILD